jgi:hypothetical protein
MRGEPDAVSLLDGVFPGYDVNEVHDRLVRAPPAAAYAAVRAVSPQDVRLLLPLMAIRGLPGLLLRRGLAGVDPRAPVIDAFLRNGFLLLGERPGEEIVVGAVGRFWQLGGAQGVRPIGSPAEFQAFDEPGWAKAVTNFLVRPEAGGSRVTTETRIAGTDAEATRMFRRYWRVIAPGSAAIRHSWLAAIKRRAER